MEAGALTETVVLGSPDGQPPTSWPQWLYRLPPFALSRQPTQPGYDRGIFATGIDLLLGGLALHKVVHFSWTVRGNVLKIPSVAHKPWLSSG